MRAVIGVARGAASASHRLGASVRVDDASGLTFDMRGGGKQAKPDCGRPLDGRVRRLHVDEAGALEVRTSSTPSTIIFHLPSSS